MNRGTDSQKSRTGGYTIVEVLIFLTVSAMLLISTMALLSGRQNKAQFTNAVRDFETELTDIANDVSNGYYQTSNGISCSQGATGPSVTSGSSEQGANKGCIFLGRLVKLGESSPTKEGYGVYSIVGNRLNSSNDNVENLVEAKPKLLWTTSNTGVNDGLRTQNKFGFGTEVSCVAVPATASCSSGNAGIAFITRVNGVPGQNVSGSGIRTELHIYDMSLDETDPLASTFGEVVSANNATESAAICLLSGTTDQYALIYLGSSGGSGLTIKSEIHEGKTCLA